MKKLLYFVIATTLLFAACQKEVDPIEQAQTNNHEAVTFKASIEQLADPTKASINASNQLVWAEGDKIGLYVPGWGQNQPFTLVGEGGSIEGEFTWDNKTPENSFADNAEAAFFPWQGIAYGDNNVSAGTMYFKLKDWYDGYTTSGKLLTPLVASLENSSSPIKFKHAGAAVKLTINNLVSGGYKAKMSVTDEQITGNFHINPANAGTDALIPNEAANTSLNHLTLNSWKGSGAFSWIFPIPALSKPKLQFEIEDGNGIVVWHKNLKAQTSDLGRGDILVMPALDITPYSQFIQDDTDPSEPGAPDTWTFCGTINGNDWQDDIPMVTDGRYWILSGFTFVDGDKFKIRKNHKWIVDGGDEYPNGEGDTNWKFTSDNAGAKDIIFDSSDHSITVVSYKFPYPTVDLSSLAESVKMDGDMSDWTFVDALTSTGTARIRSWKFTSDKENLYFFFVLRKNRMNKSEPIYIIFDWDSTGSYSLEGDYLPGGEALVSFQPFTNSDNDDGTKPTCVNGTVSTASVNGSTTDAIEAYGNNPDTSKNGESDDYYLEVSIPKTSIPSLPTSGTINIGAGCYWGYYTGYCSVTL